jgi:hypothetical protein
VALKNINGVETAEVSLNKGLASVNMKPGNTATMKQLLDAIAKNGFTTKQSVVVARGDLVQDQGRLMLKLSGSNEALKIIGDDKQALAFVGKSVVIEGTIPEVLKGKTPDSIQPKSITPDMEKK